jgi:hypothetical protein
LYQFAALEDVERIDGLLAEGDALVQAFRVNAAFAKPSTLEAEWRRYKARLRRKPLTGLGAPGDEERAAVPPSRKRTRARMRANLCRLR